MSFTYGFYNSLNGDRKYDAMTFGQLFDGIIKDGVFMSIGEHLAVTAQSGMQVRVGTGRAWFNSTWSYNDTGMVLELTKGATLLNRIDYIVLEVDKNDVSRTNAIKIVEGTAASTPVAPTLINSDVEHIYQYPLAEVYVAAGATTISQSNITNKIGTYQCPFVTGILETIKVDDLVAQWGAEWEEWLDQRVIDANQEFAEFRDEQKALFDTWFANVQYVLSGDAAGKLQVEIDDLQENLVQMTLSAANWGDGMYSLEETYPAASYNLYVSVDKSATREQTDAWNRARILANYDANVLVATDTRPVIDIPVVIKVVKK